MAVAAGAPPPEQGVPLIYRRGTRRLLIQGVYVAITAVVIGYVFNALDLRDFGFTFLNDPAGFKVGNQWLTDTDGVTNSRITMYLVGVWSTLRAVLVAIALSTVVGVLVGVSRLSSNWLVRQLAMLFVEIFRNTPLLVQVVLVYTILLVGAPLIENVVNRGRLLLPLEPWHRVPVAGSRIPGCGARPDWFVGVWVVALLVLGFARHAAACQIGRRWSGTRDSRTSRTAGHWRCSPRARWSPSSCWGRR